MTSGNVAGEPIVTDDDEALERLAQPGRRLAHPRPADPRPVRRLRGPRLRRGAAVRAPLPRLRARCPSPSPCRCRPALAVGGDLKNAFCLGEGRRAWLSAHIGDMDDLATQHAFERAEAQLETITGVRPELLAADRHPGYRSGRWAARARRRTGRWCASSTTTRTSPPPWPSTGWTAPAR